MPNRLVPDPNRRMTSRRAFVFTSVATGLHSSGFLPSVRGATDSSTFKRIAAVVTVYRKNSHADVLVGKILEGWKQDGGVGPSLKLVSMYVDQIGSDDLSMGLSKKHGFRLCKTIRESIELDTGNVSVDGVLSVGEHGNYPVNPLGQHLYPRRRFFSEITQVFEDRGRVVPVFNDKHPGPELQDAVWMAERARALKIPWMAGSSLTVGERTPDVTLPFGSSLQSCIAVGYSGLDIYGFHTLDFLQCIVERRVTKHQGVERVHGLPLSMLRSFLNNNHIDQELLHLTLASSGTSLDRILADAQSLDSNQHALFVIRYLDGLVVPVLMLDSYAKSISIGWRDGANKLLVTRAEEKPEPRYPHFAYLLKGIEQMIYTGKPAYPVERTLIAAGILDRGLRSLQLGREQETPELQIDYTPIDYPNAPKIDLLKTY